MRVFYFIFGSLLLICLSIASCVNNQKSSAVLKSKTNQEFVSANLIGAYIGDLPCVDCDAISTVLHLERDYSYKLTYMYEGKSEDEFVEEGSWSIEKGYLSLEGVDYRYKIEPNYLVQLDLSGNEITGDLAEKYQLNKIK